MNIAIARKNLILNQEILDLIQSLNEENNVCLLALSPYSNTAGLDLPSFHFGAIPSFQGIVICTDNESFQKIKKYKYGRYIVCVNNNILEVGPSTTEEEIECLKKSMSKISVSGNLKNIAPTTIK